MSYSQGIARFLDLVAAPPTEPDQTAFLAPLCPAGSSVLDIGAGIGRTVFVLAERGVNVTAVEPDAEMYSVLLSRLALRPELHARVTPVPKRAGFALDRAFDCVCCFAVVHLLRPDERSDLLAYAWQHVQPGGKLVFEFPVASPTRVAKPSELVAARKLGESTVEFHSAMEPAERGWWYTHWLFRTTLGGKTMDEVRRTFHWYPMRHDESSDLLARHGIVAVEEYAGYDRSPYVPGESRARLIVAQRA
jgi:SAM-dependent methyltransferase